MSHSTGPKRAYVKSFPQSRTWFTVGVESRRRSLRGEARASQALLLRVPVVTSEPSRKLIVEEIGLSPAEWPLATTPPIVQETWSVDLAAIATTGPKQPFVQRGPDPAGVTSPAVRESQPIHVAPMGDRLRHLMQIPLEHLLPGPGTILEWPAPLLGFQLEGVRTLIQAEKLLLADDMGLGKSVQAAAALRILTIRRQVERTLLVVPASLLVQWRRELNKWAPELRTIVVAGHARDRSWQWDADAHVVIVSYETLRSDFTDNPDSPPRRRVWDLVILDEAQKIKNRDAEVSRESKQLRRRRSWALTGTPLENKVDELASILEFVDQDPDGPVVRLDVDRFLFERHKQLQLRRKKVEVLEQLPPKQVIHIELPLVGDQQASYQRAEVDGVVQLKEMGAEVRIQHVLELILRLKQICNFCPRSGQSAKLNDIAARLETLTAEGHKALIFSQFTDDRFGVQAVANNLGGYSPLTYTGAFSSSARDNTIQQFRNRKEHEVLILSLKAGGVGLNLQEASYVFHMDRWWNPATERQAEDRTHRMGQTVPVTVFKYTCTGTIEGRIQKILEEKQQLFDQIVDDVSIDIASQLTADELYGLFGMANPMTSPATLPAHFKGVRFEERCQQILMAFGWTVETTQKSHDGGVDLVAERLDEVGVLQRLVVQCKDYARPVGVEVVRELLGVIPPGEQTTAVVATPAGLTAEAARLARDRNVVIWDEQKLRGLEVSLVGKT